jgi:hypothetical protein
LFLQPAAFFQRLGNQPAVQVEVQMDLPEVELVSGPVADSEQRRSGLSSMLYVYLHYK